MSSFQEKKQALTARLEQRIQRAGKIGAGTPRHAQLIALILIPFVFIMAMTSSTVIKEIVDSLVPNEAALQPVLFLIGMVLFMASLILCFVWVRTGGFGIFA